MALGYGARGFPVKQNIFALGVDKGLLSCNIAISPQPGQGERQMTDYMLDPPDEGPDYWEQADDDFGALLAEVPQEFRRSLETVREAFVEGRAKELEDNRAEAKAEFLLSQREDA